MIVAQRFSLTKACDACVKAKRKCDMRLPQCGRCSQKQVNCRYKNEPLPGKSGGAESHGKAHQGVASQASKDLGTTGHSSCSHAFGCWGCMEHLSSPSRSDGLEGFSVARLPPPNGLTLMQPTLYHAMKLKSDKATADYLLAQLRSFPAMFVKSGSTPFIHPQLYRKSLPKSMRQAYAACSIEFQQSHQNHAVSSQALESTIDDLLASASSIVTFLDSLAFVQALLLVQMLTLFSPHISLKQRIEADHRERLLDQWACKLWTQAPSELPASLSHYEAYVYAESVRRTLHIWNKVRCTYDIFTKGYFVHTMFAEALPLDRRTALWDITDEEMWDKHVVNSAPDIVSYREFTSLWESGQITSGGLFETILLTACRGKRCVEAKIKSQQFIEVQGKF